MLLDKLSSRGMESRDTVGINTVPKTLNVYAYVGGDPVNAIDPSGHRALDNEGNSYVGEHSSTKQMVAQKNNSNKITSAKAVVESTAMSAGEQLTKKVPPIV